MHRPGWKRNPKAAFSCRVVSLSAHMEIYTMLEPNCAMAGFQDLNSPSRGFFSILIDQEAEETASVFSYCSGMSEFEIRL